MRLWVAAALGLLLTIGSRADASYAFYVGKDLTEDGSVLVGGTGEEVSSHWLEIVPARDHPPGAVVEVGVTAEASIPGGRTAIPQVPRTARYIATFYSDYQGFPPPLTNGGLNAHQVAVRDVWAPSRKELVDMTPTPQHGPSYSDLARLVLERAKTAREGVALIGRLIELHGYATYGGNTHLIADPNEGWVVWEFAGGQGLWAAERLGPKAVRVLYPGYIGQIPKDYLRSPDHTGSKNLIAFATERGWYDPASGPFDVHAVYGAQGVPMRTGDVKYVDQATLEADLLRLAPVSMADMMAAVRDPRVADDEAGYGQVAALREVPLAGLGLLWVAPTGSITAPFVPWYLGARSVPPELGQHRYLTKDAAETFVHRDFALQEATLFAGRLFKRLMYFACERPEVFLPEITRALTAFEARALEDRAAVEATARILYRAEPALAERHLTFYSHTRAEQALALGQALLSSVEARTKLVYGLRRPAGAAINEPAAAGRDTVHCRDSASGLEGAALLERIGTIRDRP